MNAQQKDAEILELMSKYQLKEFSIRSKSNFDFGHSIGDSSRSVDINIELSFTEKEGVEAPPLVSEDQKLNHLLATEIEAS